MKKKSERTRPNDYPELQVGYPERNDVRNPNGEMERIHVNLENLELKRLTAEGVTRELRSPGNVNSI
ncbi:MAG TPA: hypothetical protein VD927_09865 [Chryseosolibacter sp.]|nr:hypothetical protein [Chryseosolibacter sp.]